MASADSAPEEGRWSAVVEHVVEIWDNLWKKNLWKRILKNVVATTTLGRWFSNQIPALNTNWIVKLAYVSSQARRLQLEGPPTWAPLPLSLAIQADVLVKWQKL